MKNGYLMRPHRREDYITKMTAVSPDSKQKPELWFRFLDEITNRDRARQTYLQRVAGYCTMGVTTEHVMFFLYGTGANGKSVFVNTVAAILGDYAKVAAIDTFTATPSPQHSTSLAALRGARLVTAMETEEGSRWAEAKIKSITGGDSVTCRYLYHDEFTYKPQFKLMISGNHKPRLRNIDEAMRRRIHIIPFDTTIAPSKRDPQLAEKLTLEWPGIFHWMLEGCIAWQREGLNPPPAVTGATDEYLREQDSVRRWLEEKTETDVNSRIAPSELYKSFCNWAERENEFKFRQIQFAQKLATHGYESKKSHGSRVIHGLKLRQPKFAGPGGA
jgi:putative DNA primase/helicase